MNEKINMRQFLTVLLFVTLFFSALFGFLLIVNALQLKASPVVDNPALEAALPQGDDEARASQYRELQLMARKVFFIKLGQVRTARWFLIMALGLFFFSWQTLALLEGKPLFKVSITRRETSPFFRNIISGLLIFVLLMGATGTAASIISEKDMEKRLAEAVPSGDAGTDDSGLSEEEVCPCVKIRALGDDYVSVAEDSNGFYAGFRGASGIGVVAGAEPSLEWNWETGAGILWSTALPLPGKSSPVVWGDHVYITGADVSGKAAVYCLDRNTGAILWDFDLAGAPGLSRGFPETTPDTGPSVPTPAADGNGVYTLFAGGQAVALSHDGSLLWTHDFGIPSISFGYASSPRCFRGRLFVQYCQDGPSVLYILDSASGDILKEVPLEEGMSWAGPVLIDTGKETLVAVAGYQNVTVIDPMSGDILWQEPLLSGEVAPNLAFAGETVFTVSPGYDFRAVNLYKPETLWFDEQTFSDVASPVSANGLVFSATSYGFLICMDAANGEILWMHEQTEGWYSSPLVLGDYLYATDRAGNTQIFPLTRDYTEPKICTLGGSVDATPACDGGVLIFRVEDGNGGSRLTAAGENP